MSERMGAEHYGEERAETAEALAELIIAEELKRWRWQEADLKTRSKGDSVKVALAARLREETTMTVGWIAERLAMGTRGYLNHLLYRRRKLDGELTISITDPFFDPFFADSRCRNRRPRTRVDRIGENEKRPPLFPLDCQQGAAAINNLGVTGKAVWRIAGCRAEPRT